MLICSVLWKDSILFSYAASLQDQFRCVIAFCIYQTTGVEEEGVLSRSRQHRRMRHPSSSYRQLPR
jgi:hypothetical protein